MTKRKAYLIELNQLSSDRVSELERRFEVLKQYRHMSPSEVTWYTNLIELNRSFAIRTDDELRIFYKYTRRDLL